MTAILPCDRHLKVRVDFDVRVSSEIYVAVFRSFLCILCGADTTRQPLLVETRGVSIFVQRVSRL